MRKEFVGLFSCRVRCLSAYLDLDVAIRLMTNEALIPLLLDAIPLNSSDNHLYRALSIFSSTFSTFFLPAPEPFHSIGNYGVSSIEI